MPSWCWSQRNDRTSLLQTSSEWSNLDLRIKCNKFLLAFPASLNITFSFISSPPPATPDFYPCLQHTKRLLGTCSHSYNRFSLSFMPSRIMFIYFSYLIFEILSSRSLPSLSIWVQVWARYARCDPKAPVNARLVVLPTHWSVHSIPKKRRHAPLFIPAAEARRLARYCRMRDWMLHAL